MANYSDLLKGSESECLFKMETENNNFFSEKLPIELFREVKVELLDLLVNTDNKCRKRKGRI